MTRVTKPGECTTTPILAHDWEIQTIDCTIDVCDFRVCRRCGAMTGDEEPIDRAVVPFAPSARGGGTLSWDCYEARALLAAREGRAGAGAIVAGLLDELPKCAACERPATRWWSRVHEVPDTTIVSTVTFNPFGRAKRLSRYCLNAYGKTVETVDTCDEHEADGSWASGDLPIAKLVRDAEGFAS